MPRRLLVKSYLRLAARPNFSLSHRSFAPSTWETRMKTSIESWLERSTNTLKGARTPILCGLLMASASLLGACATKENFSFLDGRRYVISELNTFDTMILDVDGKSYPWNYRIRIEPGHHVIAFQTRPASGFPFSPRKELALDVEPCMRYWFEAKKPTALSQDFEPRVNWKEPIAGCGA
jgi:hypothetical protein